MKLSEISGKTMRCSNLNNILLFMSLCLVGCATSSYRVSSREGRKVELDVTPDRVVLECELASENKEVPYGFMIHILDEEKTVLNVTQTNNLSKEDCFRRIEKISHILRTGKRIYIAGIGDIDDPKKVEKWTYTFPHLGTFSGNGRMLQFFAIANENGSCYDAYYGDRKPCPRGGEFPITRRAP
jgi:hypothetical protein